jgi:tRNA nucleotidyltransferase/poly(A) polymerase
LTLDQVAGRLTGTELVGRVAAAVASAFPELEAWVVGGAVRDAALGVEVNDIDLAVHCDPAPVARAVAKALGGFSFELSAEFPTWRAADRDGSWQVDVAAFRGPTIESDLALRDFTLGAIAVRLGSGEGLDPLGGLADLERATIRAAGPTAFSDDPLRLMRAARLAAQSGWQIEPETLDLGRASAGRA